MVVVEDQREGAGRRRNVGQQRADEHLRRRQGGAVEERLGRGGGGGGDRFDGGGNEGEEVHRIVVVRVEVRFWIWLVSAPVTLLIATLIALFSSAKIMSTIESTCPKIVVLTEVMAFAIPVWTAVLRLSS